MMKAKLIQRISYLMYAAALIILSQSCGSSKIVEGNQWETMFNGKDLTGWQPKFTGYEYGVNYKNTFQVEDGNLVVSYDEYDTFNGEFGHLFYKEKLSHYKLRLQYRFVGEQVSGAPDWAYRNSGIKFHSKAPEILPLDQPRLVAVEMQLLGGNGKDERPTGNVCSAGTHIEMDGVLITQHCNNSTSSTFHGDQWVNAEIEVRGNERVIHYINGEKVMEYEKPQLDDSDEFVQSLVKQGISLMLSEGYIALQAESHPVEFRKIELLRLK